MQLENEALNDTPNLSDDDFEQIGEFAECASRRPSGMCYGYNEGCLVLVVHISLRRGENEIREFRSTFYRAAIVSDIWRDEDTHLSCERNAKFPARDIVDNYIEQPVLVNVVELAEQGKERRQFGVRSIVRLRSLDSCLRISTKRGNPPLLSSVLLGGACNRELQDIKVRGKVSPTFFDRNSVDKIVQGGAEIMDAIASDERPMLQGRRICDLNDEAVAAALGVTLFGDNIRISFLPFNEFSLDSIEVFFGAAKLEKTTSELRTDHAIYSSDPAPGVPALC